MAEMSYRYRIYPNKQQQELIQKTFGCVRFVYNYYLNKRTVLYNKEGISFNFYDCCNDLTNLKQELDWLKEPDKCALQNSLKDLDNAFKYFFKIGHKYPKYKSKKNHRKTYRSNWMITTAGGNIRINNRRIKLPKIGWVKTKDRRLPCGRIINATIIQEPDGKYYCTICFMNEKVYSMTMTGKSVGIDLGLMDFAILSDGNRIDNPQFYKKSERKLAKLQRDMSRKTIGSSNWNKARIKVAKLHKYITNQKVDYIHKIVLDIIRNYDVICIEDLDVVSLKETNSNIRNKNVSDVSWSKFRRILESKARLYNKEIKVVDRYYPSTQICHCCGYRDEKKPVQIRAWICPNCNALLDRDLNAAINILNEGLKL